MFIKKKRYYEYNRPQIVENKNPKEGEKKYKIVQFAGRKITDDRNYKRPSQTKYDTLQSKTKIMEHTRRYVKETSGEKKRYRQYPTTYLNGHTWEDEIIKEEKTYELKEYPRDKTDFPRAWSSKCGNIDTYYEWEIKKGSKCCNSTDKEKVTLLPYDPKTNKGKYD